MLVFLFEVMQTNTFVIKLDVSYAVEMAAQKEVNIHSSVQKMLSSNKTLRVLNLTGLVDEKITAILANELHRSSLSSLVINFNARNCSFKTIKDLLHSFVESSLLHLQIEDICSLFMQRNVSHKSVQCQISCYSHVAYKLWPITLEMELLQSCCIIFMLLTVCKLVPSLALTVNGEINNHLIDKMFHMFLCSARSYVGNCSLQDVSPAEEFVLGINELYLDITSQSRSIFGP